MSNLYFIGGSPRTGKSTLRDQFLAELPMAHLSNDALRYGLRGALLGEYHVSVEELHFSGRATFRRPGETETQSTSFEKSKHEDDLAWDAALGFFDFYDREKESFLFEGMIVTPERIHELKLKNLGIHAVFLGYSSTAHFETILQHAKDDEEDWINDWVKEKGGDTTHLREWVAQEVERNREVSRQCAEYGYKYIDVTDGSYETRLEEAKGYLLNNYS